MDCQYANTEILVNRLLHYKHPCQPARLPTCKPTCPHAKPFLNLRFWTQFEHQSNLSYKVPEGLYLSLSTSEVSLQLLHRVEDGHGGRDGGHGGDGHPAVGGRLVPHVYGHLGEERRGAYSHN